MRALTVRDSCPVPTQRNVNAMGFWVVSPSPTSLLRLVAM